MDDKEEQEVPEYWKPIRRDDDNVKWEEEKQEKKKERLERKRKKREFNGKGW